jgi:5'(3')-deoxyribonucleotidase
VTKSKIAIDVDGVLADMHTPCFQLLGLKLTAGDVKRWDFFDDLQIDRRQFWETYKRLWKEYYEMIPLIEEEAATIIAKLREKFEVHIISTRPKETFSGTVLWLKLRGIEYDRLLLLPPQIDKTEVIGNDILFLVDDNPSYGRHPKVIIYDRPWNRCVEARRRIRSLRELLEIVELLDTPPQISEVR